VFNDLIKIRFNGISSAKRIKILKNPSINPFSYPKPITTSVSKVGRETSADVKPMEIDSRQH